MLEQRPKLHFRCNRFPHGNAFDACLKYWPKSLRPCGRVALRLPPPFLSVWLSLYVCVSVLFCQLQLQAAAMRVIISAANAKCHAPVAAPPRWHPFISAHLSERCLATLLFNFSCSLMRSPEHIGFGQYSLGTGNGVFIAAYPRLGLVGYDSWEAWQGGSNYSSFVGAS